MLATFNSTWDWTAVGTLTLAIVTGVSLAFGWGSLKQAQKGLALSRAEVEEAHRPVIVAVISKRLMDLVSDGSGETRPTRAYESPRTRVYIVRCRTWSNRSCRRAAEAFDAYALSSSRTFTICRLM